MKRGGKEGVRGIMVNICGSVKELDSKNTKHYYVEPTLCYANNIIKTTE